MENTQKHYFGKEFIENLRTRDNSNDGDYTNEDGLLTCGKCHTPKQTLQTFPWEEHTLLCNSVCKCRRAEIEFETKQRKRAEFRLKHCDITKSEYGEMTFENSVRMDADLLKMSMDNVGLLFYGGVGTGKTYAACCIANRIIDQFCSVKITNISQCLATMQGSNWNNDKSDLLEQLRRFPLVVIDDLGVERATPTSLEYLYNIIDTRYKSGNPTIYTTNLSLDEIAKTENSAYERIYDRIKQNCLPVKVSGTSRRKENAASIRDKYASLLGL